METLQENGQAQLKGQGQPSAGEQPRRAAHGGHAPEPPHKSGFFRQLVGLAALRGQRHGNQGWTDNLQGAKLTDAFQGIKVSANFMLFLLFAGFFAWLFVVYFIRHNEPLANQVLGTGVTPASTASADRRLVNGARYALPLRFSPSTGQIYVPGSSAAVSEAPMPAMAPDPTQMGAYHLPMQTPSGVKLKTIVNR